MDRQERLQCSDNRGFALPKASNFNYLLKKAIPFEQRKFNLSKRYFSVLAIILLFSFITTPCFAYTNEDLANAIFKAENSKKYPYGILTHYKHTTPRQACLNTISHAQRDWNGKGDFILFLSKRYAPINSDTDNGTNKFWYQNVKYFLSKNEK